MDIKNQGLKICITSTQITLIKSCLGYLCFYFFKSVILLLPKYAFDHLKSKSNIFIRIL